MSEDKDQFPSPFAAGPWDWNEKMRVYAPPQIPKLFTGRVKRTVDPPIVVVPDYKAGTCPVRSVMVDRSPVDSHSFHLWSELKNYRSGIFPDAGDVTEHLTGYTGMEMPVSQLVRHDNMGRYQRNPEHSRSPFQQGYRFDDNEEEQVKATVHDHAWAKLSDPRKLPFASSLNHYLSCWDGRHSHAILGTPGGDIAEFITGLSVLERDRSLQDVFTFEQVEAFVNDYLQHRFKFYLHSDEETWMKLLRGKLLCVCASGFYSCRNGRLCGELWRS